MENNQYALNREFFKYLINSNKSHVVMEILLITYIFIQIMFER